MDTAVAQQHWNAYMDAFGAAAGDERMRLLESCVADDVVFTNPAGEGRSRAGLNEHIERFRQGNPGAYFRTEQLYAQADKLLARWTMHRPDGTPVATGYNFVRYDEDGRFGYLAGFF